jgi:phosphate transport system substrate-binding protein
VRFAGGDRRPGLRSFLRRGCAYGLAVLGLAALPLSVVAAEVPAAEVMGTLKIGGTGAALESIRTVAEAFRKEHPGVRVVIPPSLGSSGGIKAVLAGTLDVGLSSRPLTPAEVGHGAVAQEYGRSPLLLVTSHRGPPIELTLSEIAALYAGEKKNYPNGRPIRIIMRPDSEIDLQMIRGLSPEMDQAVQKAEVREGMIVAVNDQDNGNALERISGALGWITLTQFIAEGREVTPLPVNNIAPDRGNFDSGAWPLSKAFSVVYKTPPTPLVKSFLEFLTSARGQEILVKNGYVVDAKNP